MIANQNEKDERIKWWGAASDLCCAFSLSSLLTAKFTLAITEGSGADKMVLSGAADEEDTGLLLLMASCCTPAVLVFSSCCLGFSTNFPTPQGILSPKVCAEYAIHG